MLMSALILLCTAAALLSIGAIWLITRESNNLGDAVAGPISVLKPLCGADDSLESNLETFFNQRYSDYELVFGVEQRLTRGAVGDHHGFPGHRNGERGLLGDALGDGLVTVIPALMVSISGGLIVTRAGSEARLGAEFHRQIFGKWQPLLLASGVLVALAALPSMPKLPFLIMAGGAGVPPAS